VRGARAGDVLFGADSQSRLRAIVNGFKKKYPFVAIESWRGTEVAITQKMLAELRAGTPVGDTLEGSELAPLFLKSGLLQKFTSPELGKIPPLYRDKSGQTAATRFAITAPPITPSSFRPARSPRPSRICSIPNGRIAWPGASARTAARICSLPTSC